MKYDSLSRNTVKITLSEADMAEYSLCSESIALHTPEIKRSLARLLEKMKLFPDCRPDRLFLEAFPKREGGCVLYVSTLGTEYPENGSCEEEAPLVCTAANLDILVQICFGLKHMANSPETWVYRRRSDYAVAVITTPENYGKIRSLLSEYGEVTRSASEICALSEYCTPLCRGNACEALSLLY